jgi:alpha-1,4-glucan:alpha-1,4-glucan 6-glycosyltransferase/4-alpha-glucanotransferase
MANTEPLNQLRILARSYGIDDRGAGPKRSRTTASPETLLAVLQSLGAPLAGLHDIADAQVARDRTLWSEIAPTVLVAWNGQIGQGIAIRIPKTMVDRSVCARFDVAGETHSFEFRLDSLPITAMQAIGGTDYLQLAWATDGVLPPVPTGTHPYSLEGDGFSAQGTVLSAPMSGGTNRLTGKRWGIVAPLFAVPPERNWGTADLGDLEALGHWAADQGARVMATLPLLSGFYEDSFDTSPYAPVSRQFWNELYIDIDRLPELRTSPGAVQLLESSNFEREGRALRERNSVDYRAAIALKRRALEAIVAELGEMTPRREADFHSFLAASPNVVPYARFRAAGERFGTQWRNWPDRLRRGHIRFNDVNPLAETYHRYCQWVLHEQLTETKHALAARGVDFELDLPLGVHADGFEVWSEPGEYVEGIEVGSPPDAFYPGGQCWGFAPMHPERARAGGHRSLRAVIAQHLRYAATLRIDHVMQLERLWWVPVGAEASEGVYVHTPIEERLAACCVEAALAGANLVGENLGTVSGAMDTALSEHAIQGMSVLEFPPPSTRQAALPMIPQRSVASLRTHDMPTFATWWSDADLDEPQWSGPGRTRLAREVRRKRALTRSAIWKRSGGRGPVPRAASSDLLVAALEHIASSPAETVLLNLEDLWLETEPQNRPGTTDDRNWSYRFPYGVEALQNDGPWSPPLGQLRALRPPRHAPATTVQYGTRQWSALDLHLFHEGRHYQLHQLFGAHPQTVDECEGVHFSIWAPNADAVAVMGDFNGWSTDAHPLGPGSAPGVWEGFVASAVPGQNYKYVIWPLNQRGPLEKADPFARVTEVPPRSASVIPATRSYRWHDTAWMGRRSRFRFEERPMSVYEVHLGSWMRNSDGSFLTYRELAPRLAEYLSSLGFTHAEFMPVMEHPFFGSWGYQITGYFAPTSRYGTREDFKYLVDTLHQHNVGVILDWVPSHFPSDGHALAEFDGSYLFEHDDPERRVHPDWGSYEFDYRNPFVRSFLISNARWWLEEFHADGLRADAVASMLYLDYSRERSNWKPNKYGGKEHLEAIQFLQELNTEVHRAIPDAVMIAEESTAWPGVTAPVASGGLGFDLKWDLGWMHDSLTFFRDDPIHRKHHYNRLTFRSIYAYAERFLLPLSHDEVVHGKGSLLEKMPGDPWQKTANLRVLLGYQYAVPGKKLLFMGGELAEPSEWNHDSTLDWDGAATTDRAPMRAWVRHLNELYQRLPALSARDNAPEGFEWISCDDFQNSVISLVRHGVRPEDDLLVVCNLTPVPRNGYRVGITSAGNWKIVGNSDDPQFGGSGFPVAPSMASEAIPMHGKAHSLSIDLPPLCTLFLATFREVS